MLPAERCRLCRLPEPGCGLKNAGLFTNIRASAYWPGTQHALSPFATLYFHLEDGFQDSEGKSVALYAVAARPGDVATTVPEPQSLVLALLTLGSTVVARKKRPA